MTHSRLFLSKYYSGSTKFFPRFAALALALLVVVFSSPAQESRITKPVDNQTRVTLTGHIHPKARPENDLGRVSPGLELSTVMLILAPSAAQKTALDQFLKDQQTLGSPSYHQWLTPEQYAERFGASESDIAKLSTWLQSQGLSIASIARGRNAISVNGTAAQVEAAFQTELHYYQSGAEKHFANSTEPTVPAAFQSIVRSVRGLHDFRMKAQSHKAHPADTAGRGVHYIAPNDLATIYNISPLYAAGFDGTGQKLVVAGQTVVNLSDITTFRSNYNLSTNTPQTILVPGTRSPGISDLDLPEADLDLEWSGAVARNATILFVYTEDVMNSVQYAIDQNLAPVVTVSYGSCEPETLQSDALTFQSWAIQGNAEGITWFNASGDDGAADCGDTQNPGLSVDTPGSVPQITAVGGTEFNEGSGTFWNVTNDGNSASALSYIPEMAWNDSTEDGTPSATGGGASIYFTKPSWQVGNGVPNDNARHVPDVALSASADHDGYLVFTAGQLEIYGGTSVPTPCFAGLATLLNQYNVQNGGNAGLGNINPNLYSLAATNYAGIFHDVTVGNNIVTIACSRRSPNCSASAVGFNAAPGYDQTTGWGSVNANSFVTGWSGAITTPPPSTETITLASNITTMFSSDIAYLTATVVNSTGITPAGSVAFEDNGVILGSATLVGSQGSAWATLAITGSQLPVGSSTISADISGASASLNVNLASSGSSKVSAPSITSLTDGASFQQQFSPGGILSIFGSQFSSASPQSAGSVPLPISMSGVEVLVNGEPAPLYYASSTQLNVQIPYEIGTGAATVTVNNNGKVTTQGITIKATGPGIFTDAKSFLVPTNTAAAGSELAFYISGAGAVTPALFTGTAPTTTVLANLPTPQTPVVKVNGQVATIDFVGIPDGLVGVVQINITVPSGTPTGVQPVTVTIGNVTSIAAMVTITN